MEIILIILTSAILGTLFVGSFMFGYEKGKQEKKEDELVLTEENKELIKEMAEWRNFLGK